MSVKFSDCLCTWMNIVTECFTTRITRQLTAPNLKFEVVNSNKVEKLDLVKINVKSGMKLVSLLLLLAYVFSSLHVDDGVWWTTWCSSNCFSKFWHYSMLLFPYTDIQLTSAEAPHGQLICWAELHLEHTSGSREVMLHYLLNKASRAMDYSTPVPIR